EEVVIKWRLSSQGNSGTPLLQGHGILVGKQRKSCWRELTRSGAIPCPSEGIHIDCLQGCRSRILRKDRGIGGKIFLHPVEFFLCPRTTELVLTHHILSLPIIEYHNIPV